MAKKKQSLKESRAKTNLPRVVYIDQYDARTQVSMPAYPTIDGAIGRTDDEDAMIGVYELVGRKRISVQRKIEDVPTTLRKRKK